jgi:molybdopterin/thiamine biosynthesis adenylyltransferase/rhodanese-related sulfurtransferase
MVESIHPKAAYQLIKADRVSVIDIRPQSIANIGLIADSELMTAQQLIQQQEQILLKCQQILILCQNGEQSAQLCELLGSGFKSIEGGFDHWLALNLPVERSAMSAFHDRYQHQINLAGFGTKSQQSLSHAHVIVVGAGGLGAPALLYLAGSGVGNITLVDDDSVVLSNLHRQILFNEADLGMSKAEQAKIKLQQLNSGLKIKACQQRLDVHNVAKLLKGADLVLDGTDNYASRYLINDYCLANGIAWVYASVTGYDLQVGMFGMPEQDHCFRCLFPHLADDANGCTDHGVLGPVAGIAAMLQVTEAIKFLTHAGGALQQQMIHYNVMTHRFKMLKYPPQIKCPHR